MPALTFSQIANMVGGRVIQGGDVMTHSRSGDAPTIATGDVAFPAVILSELIGYLNDPQSVQESQRNIYMRDLFN